MKEKKSHIHTTASVHPSVIIEGEVVIGPNTVIGAHSYLKGPLVIGANNQIGQQVMIGVDPEHKSKPPVGRVTIDDYICHVLKKEIFYEIADTTSHTSERRSRQSNS